MQQVFVSYHPQASVFVVTMKSCGRNLTSAPRIPRPKKKFKKTYLFSLTNASKWDTLQTWLTTQENTMTYEYTLQYFQHNDLENPEGDTFDRLEQAKDALDIVSDEDIEEFDIHDAISHIASHFNVDAVELLRHYDDRQMALSYMRFG
jgi:hypothetical protein